MTNYRRSIPALVAAAALTLGACSSGGSGGGEAPRSASERKLVTTTPAAKGDIDSVTWALPTGEPFLIDPARTGDYSPNTVTANLCESLLQVQPDFSLKPNLATSYEQVDDTTLTFKLRDGVTFWDGTPMTAEDVVFSLKRNMDLDLQGAVYGAVYQYVKSIEATGDSEVTIKFTQPDASFLPSFAGLAGAVNKRQFVEAAGNEYGSASAGLMCTGPFKFGGWKSGDSITITANDSYWNADLKPKAGEIVFKFFTDDNTLTSSLTTGAVDGSFQIPPTSTPSLQKSNSGSLYFGPSTSYISIQPFTSTGPAADPRLRRALDLSLDKSAFVKTALFGHGDPLKQFTTPFQWSADPAKKTYDDAYEKLEIGPDLAEAKKLVAQVEDKRPLTVVTLAGNALQQQLATYAQSAAKKVGIKLTIKQVQQSQVNDMFFNPKAREGVDFIVLGGYWEAPTPLFQTAQLIFKGTPFNVIDYDNPTATKELGEAYAALDPQVSADHFAAAQAAWHEDRRIIAVAGLDSGLYMNKKITGAPASIAFVSYPWAARVGAASD